MPKPKKITIVVNTEDVEFVNSVKVYNIKVDIDYLFEVIKNRIK